MSPRVSKEQLNQRRNHILDAAKRVFERKGYEPVTMQDIVKEAGISRGNLYQYFSNTEEIMRAVIKKSDQSFFAYIHDLINGHEKIWDAIQAYQREVLEDVTGNFGMVMYEYSVISWRNADRKQFFQKRGKIAMENFLMLLKKGVEHGEFDPIQPLETIVRFMVNVWDGLILMAHIEGMKSAAVAGQLEALNLYLKQALRPREEVEWRLN